MWRVVPRNARATRRDIKIPADLAYQVDTMSLCSANDTNGVDLIMRFG
jgi:hypothetical protein